MNKKIQFRFLTYLLLLVVFNTSSPALAVEDWQTRTIPYDIEAGVICVLDGCMMNLAVCDTTAANKLREVIREKLYKEGQTVDQTYAYLSQVYGEKVLAAPPKKGFNWLAWLTPFAATIGGGAIIYLGLEKWVIPTWKNEEKTTDIDTAYEEKLNEEIKKYL